MEVWGATSPETRRAIVRTLREFLEPDRSHRSTVVPLHRGRPRRAGVAPVRVEGLEAREALASEVRALAARERLILFRSYVEDVPLAQVAAEVGVSRAYCYKLRNRALAKLVSALAGERVAS